jgi:hypothetical protein
MIKTILRERGRGRENYSPFLFSSSNLVLQRGRNRIGSRTMRPREGNGWMENRRERRRGGGGRDTRRRPPSPPFPFSPLVVAVWPALAWPPDGLFTCWLRFGRFRFHLCMPLHHHRSPIGTQTPALGLLAIPATLRICTCKGLLRLIWRLTVWRPCTTITQKKNNNNNYIQYMAYLDKG